MTGFSIRFTMHLCQEPKPERSNGCTHDSIQAAALWELYEVLWELYEVGRSQNPLNGDVRRLFRSCLQIRGMLSGRTSRACAANRIAALAAPKPW